MNTIRNSFLAPAAFTVSLTCFLLTWGVPAMKRLRFLVALITDDNDFQVEQARAAEATAQRLGVDVEVVYAANDSINQSQQLLNVIQGDASKHPDAIIFEPVSGTALPHVGRAAAAAGIAWVVLNRQAEYLAELRRTSRAPVFCVSSITSRSGVSRAASSARWFRKAAPHYLFRDRQTLPPPCNAASVCRKLCRATSSSLR